MDFLAGLGELQFSVLTLRFAEVLEAVAEQQQAEQGERERAAVDLLVLLEARQEMD
jgi:hypothetical protein